jgi:hypothetical protein
VRQQRLPHRLRAIARHGDTDAVILAVAADKKLHLAAVALELAGARLALIRARQRSTRSSVNGLSK